VGDADSCGKSGAGETPQAKPRRLTARPRKAKSPTEIKSGINTRLSKLSVLKTVKQILANPDTFPEKYVII
jgi:hypothetical protein